MEGKEFEYVASDRERVTGAILLGCSRDVMFILSHLNARRRCHKNFGRGIFIFVGKMLGAVVSGPLIPKVKRDSREECPAKR